MTDGVEIIAIETAKTGSTHPITSLGGSPIKDFDTIRFLLVHPSELAPASFVLRRLGQPSFDVSGYSTLEISRTASSYSPTGTDMPVLKRKVNGAGVLYNVGLPAPTFSISQDLNFGDTFGSVLAAIHPHAEVCDALQLNASAVGGVEYEMYGTFVGTKSGMIAVIDWATDGGSDIEILTDLGGAALDDYEEIRVVSIGTGTGTPSMYPRAKGGSYFTAADWARGRYGASIEDYVANTSPFYLNWGDGVCVIRNFGLPGPVQQRIDGQTASGVYTTLVTHGTRDDVLDALKIPAAGQPTTGTTWITGVKK